MGLEEPNTIDIVATDNGKLLLIITDAGITTNPQERLKKLVAKLQSYVGYVMSAKFKKEHPGMQPRNVIIKVMAADKPTDEMLKIVKVAPRGDRVNVIPVHYEWETTQKKEDTPKEGIIGSFVRRFKRK